MIELCGHDNIEIRDTANDLIGAMMAQIAEGLTEGKQVHKDIFKSIILKFYDILGESKEYGSLVIPAIKAGTSALAVN